MSDTESEAWFNAVVAPALGQPVDAALQRTEADVSAYEKRFGFPSDEVGPRIDRGQLVEDDTVCRWLLAVRIRDHLRRIATGTSIR